MARAKPNPEHRDAGKKFYDLNRDPIVSPYTGKSYPRSYFEALSDAGNPIEAAIVASRFSMTRADLAGTLGLGRDALERQDRVNSRKSQQRLRELLEIVSLAKVWAKNDLAALSWYRGTPIPAFGGRTAEALVKDGNAEAVRDYLDDLARGSYA